MEWEIGPRTRKFVLGRRVGPFRISCTRAVLGFALILYKNSMILIISDNYIIVDELIINQNQYNRDSYIREVCANPKIVPLPSTPKEIRLERLKLKENEEVLHFTCNGKLNGANRLTIGFETSKTNYGSFIRQWFEVCTEA